MSSRVDACRRKAEECERGALRVADPLVRASYVEMARRWREMADRTEAIVPVTANSFSWPSIRERKQDAA